MQMSKDSVRFLSTGMFTVLDTDNNGLIDGLEFLSVLSVLSGMYKHEIIEFILSLYDFSNVAALTFDEVVLALKSTVKGLLKVPNKKEFSRTTLTECSDAFLEEVVSVVFCAVGNSSSSTLNNDYLNIRIGIRELSLQFLQIPEVVGWLEYFSNEKLETNKGNEIDEKGVLLDRFDALRLRSPSTYTMMKRSYVKPEIIGANNSSTTMAALPEKSAKSGSSNPNTNAMKGGGNQQWKSQVALLVPTDKANEVIPKTCPTSELGVNWIYGLETFTTLRNVFYTKSDEIVYNVGRFIILYNSSNNNQRFITCHVRNISCLSLHKGSNIIASGEVGEDPHLFLWDASSLEMKKKYILVGGNSITEICFSTDSSVVVFVDNSKDGKILTVWKWKENVVLFKDLIYSSFVYSSVAVSNDRFAISHDDYITFWMKSGNAGSFIRRKAIWIKNKKMETISCMTNSNSGDNLIVGSVNGGLVAFNGFTAMKYIMAHTAAITVIIPSSDGYLTASKDSRIRSWNTLLEPRFLFDISKFSTEPSILSLSLSSDSSLLLFSTIACEVFEISSLDGSDTRGGPLLQGHRFGAINDLDAHPNKLEAVSIGSDHTLRIFDLNLKCQIKLANLGFEGTCVAYSPLGDIIAVGCYSVSSIAAVGNSNTLDYKFAILSEETLNILHVARDTASIVCFLKFSLDGEILAVGCVDGGVLLYSVPDEYELICKCSRHTRAICGVDFSTEGEWLRTNSIDGELHFFAVDDGSYQSNLASMRDIQWSSQDCIYSWHNKGIHGSNDKKSGEVITVNTMLPSASSSSSLPDPISTSLPSSSSSPLLIAGTSNGALKVFSYPAIHDDAEFSLFRLHTSKITKLRFSCDGSTLLSCGSCDRAIIQFNVHNKFYSTPFSIHPLPAFLQYSKNLLKDVESRILPVSVAKLNQLARANDNDHFIWDKILSQPEVILRENRDLPSVSLSLERVYGYDSSVRSNVFYSNEGEVIYTASKYGLSWNRSNDSQKIFKVRSPVSVAIPF
jgi:WD40 repeat protein